MNRLLFAALCVSASFTAGTSECAPQLQNVDGSCSDGDDSSALLQAKMQYDAEEGDMSEEAHEMQGPKKKTILRCDKDGDTNCCFTQAGADFALKSGVVSQGTKAGMCAAGAKELYPDKWNKLLSANYAVVCPGDECTNWSPKGLKPGLGKGPASGKCSDFKCPAPKMLPKKAVAEDALCTEVSECEFNCCDVNINGDKKARNEILTFATIMVLKNVSAIASDLDEELGREKKHDLGKDVKLLKANVVGLYNAMQKVLGAEKGKKYCPGGDIFSIKGCTHNALCVIEKNMDPKGAEALSKKELKTYTLLMELYDKFQDVTWDRMMVALGNKTKGMDFDHVGAAELACSGLSGSLKKLSKKSLLETDTEELSQEQEAAYRVSASLVDAARTTHALLDSHNANSSEDETVAALHSAWQVPCEMLGCDHTNYWDLFGASHRHSLALIESGASASHMRVHVGVRTRLEHRMQTFLGTYGKIAGRVIETQGTATEANVRAYVDVLCDSAIQLWTEHPKKYGVNSLLLSLVPREQLTDHAKTDLQKEAVQAVLDDRLIMHAKKATLQNMMQEKGLSVSDEVDEEDDAPLSVVERSSLLDRSLSRKGVKKAFENVGKGVVKVAKAVGGAVVETFTKVGEAIVTVATALGEVVSAFVDFVLSLVNCLGFAAVGSVGYAKAFPPGLVPINKYVKIVVAISVQGALDAVLHGRANGAIGIAINLGIVVGAIIGDGSTGLSVGVGVMAGFACGVNSNGKGSCSFTLGVGVTASAAVTKSMDPRCPFGTPVWNPIGLVAFVMTFMTFKCSVSYGVTVKIMCCSFNLMTGCQSCGTGGCKDETTGSAVSGSSATTNSVNSGGAGAISCDETLSGNGAGYRGCQQHTQGGRTCQKWSAQKPHAHNQCSKTSKTLNNGDAIQVGAVIGLQGGHSRRWCADEHNVVKCNRGGIGQWEKFTVGGGSGTISLKGGKDGRWCADEHNTIKCNRNGIGQWEKFTVSGVGNNQFALKGGKDGRWCADEYNTVKCNRNGIGAWEKFSVRTLTKATATEWCVSASDTSRGLGDHGICRNPNGHNTIWCYTTDPHKTWENCSPVGASGGGGGGGLSPGSTVGLKGGKDGRYCADEHNNIKCNRNGIGQWEKFYVQDGGGGTRALRGGRDNRWCADEHNVVKCNRNGIGQWEKFTVGGGGGTISLKGGKDGRWCADEHNTVKCNRNGIGQWEKFTVTNAR